MSLLKNAESTEKTRVCEVCAAPGAAIDFDLVFLIDRWERLPEHVRTGIVAMVRATSE
ncbi:hypothetical protein [Symmachiella dynata]|uniref:hypothetical protein n=1 Tax=Symmachiella dynata TaxID=2527995 RepID=UPI0018D407A1|nr:hypothetical protein [Symmachiella dynata]